MSAITVDPWLGDLPAERPQIGRPAKVPGQPQTRLRKIHCEACGFIARTTRGALIRSGLPSCGCGERMTLADLRDRAAVEWDALETELRGYGQAAYIAAMRELGERPEIETGGDYGRGGAAQHRCEWAGGYCVRFTSTPYCNEHTPGGLDSHYSERRGA